MKKQRLEVNWTPELESELRELFLAARVVPLVNSTATPELLIMAVQEERKFAQECVTLVRRALERTAPATVDSEVLGAMDRLKLKASTTTLTP